MTDSSKNPQVSAEPTFEQNVLTAAKGGSILAAGKLFEFGSRFVIAFMLARLLGAQQYGVYVLAISAATIIAGIATLGLDSALVRYVAILNSKRDEAGVWGTLQVGIGGALAMSLLISLGLFFLAQPIAEQLFHEPQLVPLLRLLSIIIPFLTLSNVLVGAAHGFKKMEYSAVSLNFVQLSVRIVLIGIFALVGLNAYLTVVAFGLSDVAAVVVLIYLLNRTFSWKRPLSSARRDIREISSFSLPLWLSGVLKKSRKRIEIIVLGSLSTVTAVGIFSLISRINLIGRVAYLSVLTSVKPVIAELYSKRDWVQMGGLYQTTTRWTFTLNLPMFLVMILFPESILAIFGQSFVNGATALTIIACAELVNAGTGICGSIIDMTGHTKLKLVNSILWIIVSLGSNILLVPRWGVLGAATAVLISTSLINLLRVVEVWVLFRMLPYNLKFAKPVAAALAAFAVALVIDQWFSAQTGLLIVTFQMLMVVTVYAGVLILLGLAPEDRTVVARMFRRVSYYVLPKPSHTGHHLP